MRYRRVMGGLLLVLLGLLWWQARGWTQQEELLFVAVQMPADARLQYRDEQGIWRDGPAPGWQTVASGVYAWGDPLQPEEQPRPLFDRVQMEQTAAECVQIKSCRVAVSPGQSALGCWQAMKEKDALLWPKSRGTARYS